MKKIALIGQGGHSKVVRDIADENNYQVYAVLDDKYNDIFSQEDIVYGPISYVEEIVKNKDVALIIAIGNNFTRQRISQMLESMDAQLATLIHPTAVISPSVKVGKGSVVMANCIINAGSIIGDHVILNSGSIIEHDNYIGDYAHISPGAVLTGNVQVGEGSQVGAGATVIPGIEVGDWTIVGAGSTVTTNIPSKVTVVGSPAKIINKSTFKYPE